MLLYVPNVVGYVRIVIFCIAVQCTRVNPLVAYLLYLCTFACDSLDGILARRLNQVSLFGAFLDVAIDIAARGYLWVSCAPHPWGFFALFIEMLVFVCIHAVCGVVWGCCWSLAAHVWLLHSACKVHTATPYMDTHSPNPCHTYTHCQTPHTLSLQVPIGRMICRLQTHHG